LARRLPVVTGEPYSADYVTEIVQTMPDGTRQSVPREKYRIYRDSEGRTRYERQPPVFSRSNGRTFPPMVEIHDPVAGVTYVVDMEAKVAHRIAMDSAQAPRAEGAVPLPPSGIPPRPPAAVPPRPPGAIPGLRGGNVEDLGDQMIEGVLAHGQRTTLSVNPPPGRGGTPLVQVTERWYSPDLRVDILTKTTTNSESTQKLFNISRAEPSILLFEPPADFRVVDETGAGVAISYVAQ
jgi:hypothetical protein